MAHQKKSTHIRSRRKFSREPQRDTTVRSGQSRQFSGDDFIPVAFAVIRIGVGARGQLYSGSWNIDVFPEPLSSHAMCQLFSA